jgi:hypothetical protein
MLTSELELKCGSSIDDQCRCNSCEKSTGSLRKHAAKWCAIRAVGAEEVISRGEVRPRQADIFILVRP